ncbi:Hypothetical predicted protein [Pelobates cultripes]|uniref:Uncharacterized protein n=1 Tax=Pelobates cultripes TaxID=61616 RepID=A0AAD1T2Y8_PELCU|nr:Hypothetical predicted protein [Pelobates cultripes]
MGVVTVPQAPQQATGTMDSLHEAKQGATKMVDHSDTIVSDKRRQQHAKTETLAARLQPDTPNRNPPAKGQSHRRKEDRGYSPGQLDGPYSKPPRQGPPRTRSNNGHDPEGESAETDSRRKTRAQTALDTQRLPDPQQHSTPGAYRRRASYRTPHLHGQPSPRSEHTEEPQPNDASPDHAGPDRRKRETGDTSEGLTWQNSVWPQRGIG